MSLTMLWERIAGTTPQPSWGYSDGSKVRKFSTTSTTLDLRDSSRGIFEEEVDALREKPGRLIDCGRSRPGERDIKLSDDVGQHLAILRKLNRIEHLTENGLATVRNENGLGLFATSGCGGGRGVQSNASVPRPRREVSFVWKCPPACRSWPIPRCDRGMINLVSNASKFSCGFYGDRPWPAARV